MRKKQRARVRGVKITWAHIKVMVKQRLLKTWERLDMERPEVTSLQVQATHDPNPHWFRTQLLPPRIQVVEKTKWIRHHDTSDFGE